MRILLHPFSDRQNSIMRKFLLAAIAKQTERSQIMPVLGDDQRLLDEMLDELKKQLL